MNEETRIKLRETRRLEAYTLSNRERSPRISEDSIFYYLTEGEGGKGRAKTCRHHHDCSWLCR